MRKLITIIAVVALAHTADSYACSVANPPLMLFAPPFSRPATESVQSIEELFYRIRRGTDKDTTSCADLGFITVLVKPQQRGPNHNALIPAKFGFQFQLLDANVKDAKNAFDTAAIAPIRTEGGYYVFDFVWIDGRRSIQEPIEIRINAYVVDQWHRRSKPCLIEIQHPGGATQLEKTTGETIQCD